MDNSTKENANPIVHSVERSKRSRNMLEPFQRWSSAQSPQDRAIANALVDGKTTLLQRAGLEINISNRPSANTLSSIVVRRKRQDLLEQASKEAEMERESIDQNEIFDIIRNIQDPEHPLTLEQLNVVNRDHVHVEDHWNSDKLSIVDVRFTPTIPHCSMATLIGLSLKVKLMRSLPPRFKIKVRIQPGTHASEHAINKQLGDRERVCAALENAHLLGVVNKCIGNGMKGDLQ